MSDPSGGRSSSAATRTILSLTVLVASLGYFVDIYDLQLFNLISRKSLAGIGLTDPNLIKQYDAMLLQVQMGGMLVGGLIWGVLGDKRGRKSILFGSILLYSLANLANAGIWNIEGYVAVRFLAGLGLAGELGAAITLVSETMHHETRGWGTMVVVTVGALGAVAANVVAKAFAWQVSYLVGGGLGLALLALRVGTFESILFAQAKAAPAKRGDFFSLFQTPERAIRYLACIGVGIPVWYVIGVLIKFSESFAAATGVQGKVSTGDAIMWAYLGLSAGDLASGALSQLLKSRKKVVYLYLGTTVLLSSIYMLVHGLSPTGFYALVFLLGAATGYWALFVSIAAEQFGTNLRATTAITVPNFVRGLVIPLVSAFRFLEVSSNTVQAGLIVGAVSVGLALISTWVLPESFARNLDYLEGQPPPSNAVASGT